MKNIRLFLIINLFFLGALQASLAEDLEDRTSLSSAHSSQSLNDVQKAERLRATFSRAVVSAVMGDIYATGPMIITYAVVLSHAIDPSNIPDLVLYAFVVPAVLVGIRVACSCWHYNALHAYRDSVMPYLPPSDPLD